MARVPGRVSIGSFDKELPPVRVSIRSFDNGSRVNTEFRQLFTCRYGVPTKKFPGSRVNNKFRNGTYTGTRVVRKLSNGKGTGTNLVGTYTKRSPDSKHDLTENWNFGEVLLRQKPRLRLLLWAAGCRKRQRSGNRVCRSLSQAAVGKV